jgi:hypothetical protein
MREAAEKMASQTSHSPLVSLDVGGFGRGPAGG